MWERGCAVAESEVKADAEARMFVSERNGFFSGCAVNHETGSGEDTALVRLDNRSVDGMRASKIVSVYDEAANWGRHFECQPAP